MKTRLRRCAQVMARWRCAGVLSSFSCDVRPLPRLAGVTSPRYLLFGAKTPWNLVRFTRGLGTRKVLLGHRNGDITTHYSAPELEELVEAANRVCGEKSGKTPALVVLEQKNGNR